MQSFCHVEKAPESRNTWTYAGNTFYEWTFSPLIERKIQLNAKTNRSRDPQKQKLQLILSLRKVTFLLSNYKETIVSIIWQFIFLNNWEWLKAWERKKALNKKKWEIFEWFHVSELHVLIFNLKQDKLKKLEILKIRGLKKRDGLGIFQFRNFVDINF